MKNDGRLFSAIFGGYYLVLAMLVLFFPWHPTKDQWYRFFDVHPWQGLIFFLIIPFTAIIAEMVVHARRKRPKIEKN